MSLTLETEIVMFRREWPSCMGRTRGHMESEINKVPGEHNPSSVWSGCLLGC